MGQVDTIGAFTFISKTVVCGNTLPDIIFARLSDPQVIHFL